MTHPGSGNPTWQGWPSTGTPITALSLENIETLLDNLAAEGDRPFARYHCAISGGQNIAANNTPQNVPFDVAKDISSGVTRNGQMTVFTLNRAGVWTITAGYRLQSSASTMHQFMIWDGTNGAARYGESWSPGIANGGGNNLTIHRRFGVGATVAAGVAIMNTSTASRIATDVPESTYISFLWERP